MRTTEIQGFLRMRFSCQKPRMFMGFSGSVNGTTKNPGFLDFGFCQCKWAYQSFAQDVTLQYSDDNNARHWGCVASQLATFYGIVGDP